MPHSPPLPSRLPDVLYYPDFSQYEPVPGGIYRSQVGDIWQTAISGGAGALCGAIGGPIAGAACAYGAGKLVDYVDGEISSRRDERRRRDAHEQSRRDDAARRGRARDEAEARGYADRQARRDAGQYDTDTEPLGEPLPEPFERNGWLYEPLPSGAWHASLGPRRLVWFPGWRRWHPVEDL